LWNESEPVREGSFCARYTSPSRNRTPPRPPVAECVCAGLAIRGASMVASGDPGRLRSFPASLLRLELAVGVVASLTGLHPLVSARLAEWSATARTCAVESVRRAADAMLFVVHTIRFGIYLRPDRGRHFLKVARYRWRAPSWMARLVLHLGAEGAPPSATATPQRCLARARTGSWPGPPSTQTSPRWRPGRPVSEPPGRPRPCAAPSAAGRRPAADSRRGTPGRRGCGPATPGARRRPRPHAVTQATGRRPEDPPG